MKTLLLIAISCWAALQCQAAEIVAWKVPLSRFVERGLHAEGIVRCESAPEASPFFKEGDELWDLHKLMDDQELGSNWHLDWIVWNETSGRFVAKGDWTAICALHDRLRIEQLPKMGRVRLRTFRTTATLEMPGKNDLAANTVFLPVRSGTRASMKLSEADISVDLVAEVSVYESYQMADVRIACSIKLPGEADLTVNTAASMQSGKPLWIAHDSDGQKGVAVELTTSIESMGGVPIKELASIQHDNQIESLMPDWMEGARIPLADGWLVIYPLSPQLMMDFISPREDDPEADPFAEPSQMNRRSLPPVPSVAPPEALRPWIKNEVLDARSWIEQLVPATKMGENFSGYDPIRQCLYFFSRTENCVEQVEFEFGSICNLRPALITATLDGRGRSVLVAKSGQRASLSRIKDGELTPRSLEIEPVIGESGDVVEMRLHYEDKMMPDTAVSLNLWTILNRSKPFEILSGSKEGDSKFSLWMKADVSRFPYD